MNAYRKMSKQGIKKKKNGDQVKPYVAPSVGPDPEIESDRCRIMIFFFKCAAVSHGFFFFLQRLSFVANVTTDLMIL